MHSGVADLLGSTRLNWALGMSIVPGLPHMTTVCESALDAAKAAHPESRVEIQATGHTTGNFRGDRLHQLFANLLSVS